MPRIIVDESVCKGCGLCANACPQKIISLDTGRLNPKGYHPARLMEPEKCVRVHVPGHGHNCGKIIEK